LCPGGSGYRDLFVLAASRAPPPQGPVGSSARAGGCFWAAEAHLIFFGLLALSGIAGWWAVNAVIFRARLLNRPVSPVPSLWPHADNASGLGRLPCTYLYALADTRLPCAGLGAAGFLFSWPHAAADRFPSPPRAPFSCPSRVRPVLGSAAAAFMQDQRSISSQSGSRSLMTIPVCVLRWLSSARPPSPRAPLAAGRRSRPCPHRGGVPQRSSPAAAIINPHRAKDFRRSPVEHSNCRRRPLAARALQRRPGADGTFGNETVTFSSLTHPLRSSTKALPPVGEKTCPSADGIR